jgi:hypothetical protein
MPKQDQQYVNPSFIFVTENLARPPSAAARVAVLERRNLTSLIIGLAIESHRKTLPCLLESASAARMYLELKQACIPSQQKVSPRCL